MQRQAVVVKVRLDKKDRAIVCVGGLHVSARHLWRSSLMGRTNIGSRSDLPPGTLEMLILRTLTLGSLHGYAIAQHIAKLSDGVFKVEQGSLYPALERLLNNGWATVKWAETPTKRQARY